MLTSRVALLGRLPVLLHQPPVPPPATAASQQAPPTAPLASAASQPPKKQQQQAETVAVVPPAAPVASNGSHPPQQVPRTTDSIPVPPHARHPAHGSRMLPWSAPCPLVKHCFTHPARLSCLGVSWPPPPPQPAVGVRKPAEAAAPPGKGAAILREVSYEMSWQPKRALATVRLAAVPGRGTAPSH